MCRLCYFGRVLEPTEARAFAARWAWGTPAAARQGADLVGVRLLIGSGNFAAVAAQQQLAPALAARARRTAADLEAELAARYPDPAAGSPGPLRHMAGNRHVLAATTDADPRQVGYTVDMTFSAASAPHYAPRSRPDGVRPATGTCPATPHDGGSPGYLVA